MYVFVFVAVVTIVLVLVVAQLLLWLLQERNREINSIIAITATSVNILSMMEVHFTLFYFVK